MAVNVLTFTLTQGIHNSHWMQQRSARVSRTVLSTNVVTAGIQAYF